MYMEMENIVMSGTLSWIQISEFIWKGEIESCVMQITLSKETIREATELK